MKCPFCREDIHDGASVCRYCGRDLSFYGLSEPILKRLSLLEKEVSRISSHLDGLLSLDPQAVQRGSKELTDSSNQHEEESRPIFRTAFKFVIRNLTTVEPSWKRIGLAVVLAAIVPVVSNQMWHFVDILAPTSVQSEAVAGGVNFLSSLATTMISIGFLFSPLIFGVWAALAWPGRNSAEYIVLSLLVGTIAFVGEIGFDLLGGWAGLPDDPGKGPWTRAWKDINWQGSFVFFFVGPAFMFTAGGLLGDLIKPRKYPQEERRPSFAYRLLKNLAGPDTEPSQRLVNFLQALQILVTVLAPFVIWIITGQFPNN